MARGVNTLIDSLNLYIEHKNETSAVLTITSSATTTALSSLYSNTWHKGAVLYVHIASLTVNEATIGFNIKGYDPVNGLYYPVARVSIDSVTASSSTDYSAIIYPGIGTTGLPTNAVAVNGILPAEFVVQAELTLTTSAGQTGSLSVNTGMCRIL